jgi:hypothetical protein
MTKMGIVMVDGFVQGAESGMIGSVNTNAD